MWHSTAMPIITLGNRTSIIWPPPLQCEYLSVTSWIQLVSSPPIFLSIYLLASFVEEERFLDATYLVGFRNTFKEMIQKILFIFLLTTNVPVAYSTNFVAPRIWRDGIGTFSCYFVLWAIDPSYQISHYTKLTLSIANINCAMRPCLGILDSIIF